MEIVSGPVGFERKPSRGFEILDFLKVKAAGDGLKSKASARGLTGCVDQHWEDRIDQIGKKRVLLYILSDGFVHPCGCH